MTEENGKADFIKAPEVEPFGQFYSDPAEKEGLTRDKQDRMGEVPVMLEIEWSVKEAKGNIGIWKSPHCPTCHHPPQFPIFLSSMALTITPPVTPWVNVSIKDG